MLLSIGMIVKNEEKYLESCLTALKPILDNVDSELVIADTGSTDNTVEIAKRFTDKVYYFEWINDFSAARNFTMEKSSGEWFMFIDADEIMQSCDEIINFFRSGEYNSYGCAAYNVHSFTDEEDMTQYTDAFAMRLAKKFSDVRFKNAVHEAFDPLYGPVKFLTSTVFHYGYSYNKNGKTTEQAYEKSKRNLELLLKSLEGPDTEFSVYREIADCYTIIDDYETALKYIDKGLEELDHNYIAITQYYSYKVGLQLVIFKDYEGAVQTCNEYFGSGTPSRDKAIATDIDIYAIRGESLYRLGDYSAALNDFRQFFKLYADYKNNKLNTEDLLYNQIKVKDHNVKYIFRMFFDACIKTQEFHVAEEYLKRFDAESYQNDKPYMLMHFRQRAEIMMHIGWKSVKKFISLLDDENKELFFRVLRGKMFYTDKPEELMSVLSDFRKVVPCADDVIGIYRSYFDGVLEYENIKNFIENFGADGNADIFCIMLSCGMDISCFLTADGFNAENCIDEFYAYFGDKAFLLEEYDVDMLLPDALVNAASLYGWAMSAALNEGKNIEQLFEDFGKIAAKWQSEFPNEEKIPGDIRAGIIVHGIAEARKMKDYHTCIAEMRKLIKVCPDFAPFVSEYREVVSREATQQSNVNSELAEMANAVKRNIRSMLDAGDISSAEKTLLELEKICPADAEIGMLKFKIKMLKKQ